MFDKLIKYTQLEEACAEYFQFSGVTFLTDFGPVKAGQEFEGVTFDLETELCTCWLYPDTELHKFSFNLCA